MLQTFLLLLLNLISPSVLHESRTCISTNSLAQERAFSHTCRAGHVNVLQQRLHSQRRRSRDARHCIQFIEELRFGVVEGAVAAACQPW
jgi:hypothetical protein